MKILIFSWRDINNPKSGGAEILTHEMARRWAAGKHSVEIVSDRFPGSKTREVIDGVKISRPNRFYSYSPISYLRYLWKTKKYYQVQLAGKFDIVIDQVHGLPFFTPFFVKEKVVFSPMEVAGRIWFYEIPLPFSLIGYLLESLYIKLFAGKPFLVISSSVKNELKKSGVKQIKVVTPGSNIKPLKKMPRKTKYPSLVALGRLTPMKRLKDILKATKITGHKLPGLKLQILGRGDKKYIQKIKKYVDRLGIKSNVHFAGFVSQKAKIRILKKSWIIVSASVKEGWGLNIIEAAACGTPAAVYKVSGLVDSVKHNQTGIICPVNNPQTLAEEIIKLINDKEKREKFGKQALAYSKSFSWDQAAAKTLNILSKL